MKLPQPLLWYSFLSVLIMGALLLPGYVLTFDMAWGPRVPLAEPSTNTYLLSLLLNSISAIVPSWIIQKIILLSIFALAGWGVHRLSNLTPLPSVWHYVAGVFYTVNPFIYTRLMAGQWLVLLGYALLPWAVRAIWMFFDKPTMRHALLAGMWVSAIGLTSIHTLGFVAVIAIVSFVFSGKRLLRKKLLYSLSGIGLFVLANSFWLFQLGMPSSQTTTAIERFNNGHISAFATDPTFANSTLLSALTLTGFWADHQGRYSLPSNTALFVLAVMLFAGFVITGIWRIAAKRDRLGGALLVASFIALVLSLGVMNDALTATVPFYRGYREPHKWLMVVAIGYAYCAAAGAYAMSHFAVHRLSQAVIVRGAVICVALFLPFAMTPHLAFGAGGQLKSAFYPDGWQTVESITAAQPQAKILVLPWHQYTPLSFAGRVVAHPARHYFSQPVVTGNNPELTGVAPVTRSRLDTYITTQLLPNANTIKTTGLGSYSVTSIIVLKEADYHRYHWLNEQSDLRLVVDNASLRLYQVVVK